MIVRWEAGSSRADRSDARASVDTTEDSPSLGKRFQVLGLTDGQDPDAAVAALKDDPAVADAARDGYSELQANEPNDPLFDQLWGLDNKGLNVGGVGSSTPGDDIDALKAWGKTVGDNDPCVVADLDDGIRPQHPDLENRIWNNTGETPADGIDNDGNGYVDDTFGMDFAGANIDLNPLAFDNDPTDDIPQGGHGTHTAGTIAAEGNNGEGITGVAQKATLMPLRVCGWSPTINGGGVYCPFSSQIAAINYAGANGATIANMSLGGTSANALVQGRLRREPERPVRDRGRQQRPGRRDQRADHLPVLMGSDDLRYPRSRGQRRVRGRQRPERPAGLLLQLGQGQGGHRRSGHGDPQHVRLPQDLWTEDFETAGFPTDWTNNGWIRTNTAPLSSFVDHQRHRHANH